MKERVVTMDPFEEWQRLQDESAHYRAVQVDQEEGYWSRYAENYDLRRCLGSGLDRERDVVLGFMTPTTTLLEIGAGTGAFTLAASEKVASVTVVEPSPSMIGILKKKLHHAKRNNVNIVQSRWEDAQVASHDVVLAAGCLYVFYDIRSALEKMISSATDSVILTTSIHGGTDLYAAAAKQLNATVLSPGPDLIHLYNALYYMGIHADVRIIDSTFELLFDDLEHAVDTWAERMRLPAVKKPLLERFLAHGLRQTPYGKWTLGTMSRPNAIVRFPCGRFFNFR